MTKKLLRLGKVFLFAVLLVNTSCDEDEIILSDDNFIISFKVSTDEFEQNFDIIDNQIEGILPFQIDENNIRLDVVISEKATISPNPGSITSLNGPINFVVTAENGDENTYLVDIRGELSPENSIESFELKTNLFETLVDINEGEGIIIQKVLPNTDLTAVSSTVTISDKATISPDPTMVSDYTNPVSFTVTAENGETKEYVVTLEIMSEDYTTKCDIMNANKWFGGDDRVVPSNPDIEPRNVGTGQTLIFQKDTYPTNFGFFLVDAFRGNGTTTENGDLELDLKLNIRDVDGNIISSTTTKLTGVFNGGWIDFDLSSLDIFMKKDTPYIFTYYLVNGEELGISSGSSGNANVDSGICGALGYSGQSKKKENTSLEDWNVWWEHPWHFNFRFQGKQ